MLEQAVAKAALKLPRFHADKVIAELKSWPIEDKREMAANPALMQQCIWSVARRNLVDPKEWDKM